MNPLTVVYLSALVAGSALALSGVVISRYRRRVFFTAAVLFTVSAVLAMWTIGIAHVPLAVGCLVAGLISEGPIPERQEGRSPHHRRLRLGLVLAVALAVALAVGSMLRVGTTASETWIETPPARDAHLDGSAPMPAEHLEPEMPALGL